MELTQQQTAVEKAILAYSDAFNAADIPGIVSSYTPEGILMPNNAAIAVGTEQLSASFNALLESFQIGIQYYIDEIRVTGQYAYVRTNSEVNTRVKASGERILLENKELFVLCYLDGEWKISHYLFNNTRINKSYTEVHRA
jgi:ketosteroid isomerase-like protein